jgi:TonB-dependent SusC/RagA subfamily outer membrane receptor
MRHAATRTTVHFLIAASALVAGTACAHRAGSSAGGDPVTRMDSVQNDMRMRRVRSGLQAVTFSEADRTRFNSVAQMIQARFSGVQVSRNGDSYSIRFSGVESFQGGTEPLVIVDGATMPGTASLNAVNAKDVVRIEVLRNSAAALYGARGGNGVIVISTQRVP